MSEILETLRRKQPYQHGSYRVRCAGCERVYVTTQPTSNIRKLRQCNGCVKRRPRSLL